MAAKRSIEWAMLTIMVTMMVGVNGRSIEDEAPRSPRALFQHVEEHEAGTWFSRGQNVLKKHLEKNLNTKTAKNVIMFLGDGMGAPTIAAARILQGQRAGETGEESRLFFENFPYTGLSKTYCVDRQVADSACSATAYLGGIKNNMGTIGVTAAVRRGDCKAAGNPANHVDSIATWAQREGKATGVVTTTRITHASPTGTYGHTAERDWECDAEVVKGGGDPKLCPDIAYQLINQEPGKNHKVILGGGRRKFIPSSISEGGNLNGQREDNLHLIEMWKEDKTKKGVKSAYVTDRDGLLGVGDVDYLMGLFAHDHMLYHLDADPKHQPTLAEMTRVAIKQLSKNKEGYFLFVEGGRIDHGHHDTLAQKALDETIEFAEAVRAGVEMVADDTLIVVTADHSHTMSMAGYPKRGEDILGFGGNATDNMPYSTLTYANGPSYKPEVNGRRNMINDDRHNVNYTFPSFAPLKDETHGGEDVQVFAVGPWAHLFVGAYEQNAIPHIMGFASCIGPGLKVCPDPFSL